MMRVPRGLPEQVTTALVNEHLVGVQQQHRRWAAAECVPGPGGCVTYEPVVVTVSAPISLSLEDVVAVLFEWAAPWVELAQDETVRHLVATAVTAWGCAHLEDVRCALIEPRLDAEQCAYLAYCRDRAVAVFGTAPVSRSGGVLVGVR